jgi:hypothetical protein
MSHRGATPSFPKRIGSHNVARLRRDRSTRANVARRALAGVVAQRGDRTDRVSDGGRPFRHPGDSPLTHAPLWRHAGRHGVCRECQHHGDGGGGIAGGFVQPPHRSATRRSAEPRAARDSDGAAGGGARPDHVHDPAGCPGPVHGLGIHVDARLSRRGVQRGGCRRSVRGIHHRKCSEQSDRAPDLGRRCRSLRPGIQLLPVRAAKPRRRGPRVFHHGTDDVDAGGGADGGCLAVCIVEEPLAQSRSRRGLRHRLFHPVRLHRYLHT